MKKKRPIRNGISRQFFLVFRLDCRSVHAADAFAHIDENIFLLSVSVEDHLVRLATNARFFISAGRSL